MTEENKEVQAEELTVGQILHAARTTGRRKRELSTIAKQLCIREEFLQAIEEDNYSVIPEPVYLLGFARNYAMELGLNPDEIVAKLKKEMGMEVECIEEKQTNGTVSDNCVVKRIDENKKFDIVKVIYNYIVKHWVWFVSGLVVLLALIISLIVFVPSKDQGGFVNTEAEVAYEIQKEEPKYSVEVRERFGTENAETANVVLQATQEAWVKVEDGRGNTIFSRVLVPGDVYFVPSDGNNKATFGNAGGVDVWVNGTLIPKLGAEYTRKTGIILTPEALLK